MTRKQIYPILLILFVSILPLLILQLFGESSKTKISPEIVGISEWINSPPLTISQLKGKVVIVDFWTYSCINCLRTIPYLNAWYEKYKDKGLVIIGVHSPEFFFEREINRVQAEVNELHIHYPVALDNDKKTWNAFANQYWPHKFFIGPDGNFRFEVIGEGRYEESEQKIKELLSETGVRLNPSVKKIQGEEVDFKKIKTPEIYFGTFHGNFLGNPKKILAGKKEVFKIPPHLEDNLYYLEGKWDIKEQFAIHSDFAPAEILIYYEAKSVNWVAGKRGEGAWVEVKMDNHFLKSSELGKDVILDSEGRSKVFVSENRLYRLINNREGYGKHLLSLELKVPLIESYTFTFG